MRANVLLWQVIFFFSLSAAVQDAVAADKAPVPVQAALFLKLIAFDQSRTGDVTVHVLGDAAFANELKKGVGKPLGGGTLASVVEGTSLPTEKPSVLYIGDSTMCAKAVEYTRANDVLSITGMPDLVGKGVSLGVGITDGKPVVLLNVALSKEEGCNWNPAILKIATTVK
jgi:hypothetical protein